MKDIDTLLESAGETAEYAKQYAQLQVDYFRLEIAEQTAKAVSALFTSLVIGALGLIALIMLSLAAAFYLGRLWDSYPLAFLCLSGVYVLMVVVVLFFKDRWLTNPILTSVIRSIFK